MTTKRMSEKEIERWGRTRARGKRAFIVRQTIAFALIPAVAVIVVHSLKSVWTGKLEFGSIDYGLRLFSSVVFAFWGFIDARLRWKSSEDRYQVSQRQVE